MAALSAQSSFLLERRQPALAGSFALAAAVHLVLLGVMFLGVRWQSHRPDSVVVELWEAPPPPRAVEVPKPPPPKVEPEPELKAPEIAIKPAPKPKPKPEIKPEPKPKPDPNFEKRLREQVASEQKALDNERRERELKELIARQQAALQARALATWGDKIRSKIRPNIESRVAEQVVDNPEAIFDVTLLPTGEVLNVRRTKSSGNRNYDEAVERAISRSSPLPKPDPPGVLPRQVELRFRPQDK